LRKAYRLAASLGYVDTMCWFLRYDQLPYHPGRVWLNWTSGLRTRKRRRSQASPRRTNPIVAEAALSEAARRTSFV
jgi:hypothetical protein